MTTWMGSPTSNCTSNISSPAATPEAMLFHLYGPPLVGGQYIPPSVATVEEHVGYFSMKLIH